MNHQVTAEFFAETHAALTVRIAFGTVNAVRHLNNGHDG
jgi:hypothetical protein